MSAPGTEPANLPLFHTGMGLRAGYLQFVSRMQYTTHVEILRVSTLDEDPWSGYKCVGRTQHVQNFAGGIGISSHSRRFGELASDKFPTLLPWSTNSILTPE